MLLPLHLLLLKVLQQRKKSSERIDQQESVIGLLKEVRDIIRSQFDSQSLDHFKNSKLEERSYNTNVEALELDDVTSLATTAAQNSFYRRFLKRCVTLTLFLAAPSMCWYAAVPFTDMTTITSIYNTNAFFAYGFSVYFLETEKFQVKKTVTVLGAVVGVMIVSFGDYYGFSDIKEDQRHKVKTAKMRLGGNCLAFMASLGYAGYEVWYKKTISLKLAAPQPLSKRLRRLPSGSTGDHEELPAGFPGVMKDEVLMHDRDEESSPFITESSSGRMLIASSSKTDDTFQDNISPKLFLLHANIMTSIIGILTATLLWIPIPLIHWLGWEKFELPSETSTVLMIGGVVFTGVVYNAGFMVLLGLWGPVVASVGNLCTLVLVAIVDPFLIPENQLSFHTILGCSMIIIAFSVLISDIARSC